MMLSYHNDPLVKQKYIARFATHRAADAVVQGLGYLNGRGCFIGCTLETYSRAQFKIELGWPLWLVQVAEQIFENLPRDKAPQFGTDILQAVPVGIDLEPVKWRLAIARMDRLIAQQELLLYPEVNKVIDNLQTAKQYAIDRLDGHVHSITTITMPNSLVKQDLSPPRKSGAAALSSARRACITSNVGCPRWSMIDAVESLAWTSQATLPQLYQDECDTLLTILRSMEPNHE